MMTRHILRLLAVSSLSLLLFACGKQENEETVPVLKNLTKTVQASGGEQQLRVVTTASWTLKALSGDKQVDWVHFDPSSGEAGTFSVKMTVDPNTGSPRVATVVLQGPTLKRTAELQQLATPSVDNAPLWLELPALRETPDCHFFTHDWDGGMYVSAEVSPKRNYSFYWDKNRYISHWVAYPLNKDLHSGGYGRYDDKEGGGFPADPILTNLGWAQPYLFGKTDTYGGGWTRGHQIPSADRQVEKANMATFYVTNMTPQNYDMNGEVWAKLEGSVRSWSDRCDTLYVCTGCHPGPYATGNKSGVNVSIPDYYYKALLRKKGEDYSMAAFKIANDATVATSGYMDFIISVSELESETGEVFFAALSSYISADKIAALKSASPVGVVSKW